MNLHQARDDLIVVLHHIPHIAMNNILLQLEEAHCVHVELS